MMIQLVKARTNLEPYTKTIKELTYSFYDLVKRKNLDYESLYNNLSEMKLTSADEMELTLTEEPTTIYLGEENVWSRIEILREFERKLGNNAKKISDFDYLDMRFDKQIIVRARHS